MDGDEIRSRLDAAGVQLPPPRPAVGRYATARRVDRVLHLSGHGPMIAGRPVATGRVGDTVDLATARRCAEVTALNLLATLCAALLPGDSVEAVARLFGMVSCGPDFTRHPDVIDAASSMFEVALGERGIHARSAVGVSSLPFGIPVEIEATVVLAGVNPADSG